MEAHVVTKDFAERFLATLSKKDRQIVQLRQYGYTYEEIADALGYKNHSGVIKRIASVKKKFREYCSKEKATRSEMTGVAFSCSRPKKR